MAHHKLCVTKVAVQYAIGGRSFTVEFEPMQVGSIFFDRTAMRAAKAKQKTMTRKAPVQHKPDANAPIPEQIGYDATHAKTVYRGRSSATEGPSLWWRTEDGVWFHPGG